MSNKQKLDISKNKGEQAFEAYYREIYGERWDRLSSSLLTDSSYVDINFDNQEKTYHIDIASYFASSLAYNLIKKYQHLRILDMCSAPGGKLLALLSHISKEQDNKATLQINANEKSKNRFFRLRRNLDDFYISPKAKDSQEIDIRFSCKDANLFGRNNKGEFDFVLLDAPCSSEAHVMKDAHELSQWSPSRSKRLAQQQLSLLCAAIDATSPTSHILYATCSINPIENDQVIEKSLKKRSIEIVDIENLDRDRLTLEKQKYGTMIMPDTSQGAGPLYICIIHKI